MRKFFLSMAILAMSVVLFAAPELRVLLPLGKIDSSVSRAAYQTNEQIAVSVIRSNDGNLSDETLLFTLTGTDGSKFDFSFPLKAILAVDGTARTTEHYLLNGALLRPGTYTITVSAYGASATETIEVYSNVRNTDFKLLLWYRTNDERQAYLGENGFGFNVSFASYGGHEVDANIRSGQDYIPICVQSGGHQMDLRMECDWSDPNVLRGGVARSTLYTLMRRTWPNFLGTHFYDEPGLTWWPDGVTGVTGNMSVPAQLRSFENAFSYDVPFYEDAMESSAGSQLFEEWKEFTEWKATLMDAAWQYSKYGIKQINENYMALTQSQYGWSAFSDGYYFNITRALDVTSGHGGYDDWGPGYWHPSFTLEIARARDFDKPTWYLPTWYGNTDHTRFRVEQYLSFQTNIRGMQTPPDIDPIYNPNGPREAVAESNKLMGRLGTIFNTMPVTRGDVGILFPLSYNVYKYAEDPVKHFYAHANQMGEFIHINYIATKLLQVNSQFVLEEDVLDGTASQYYKTLLINGVEYLDSKIIDALEKYIADGGTVILDSLATINIAGAIKIDVPVNYTAESYANRVRLQAELKALEAEGTATPEEIQAFSYTVSAAAYGLRDSIVAAELVAAALKPIFNSIGIETLVETDQAGLSVTKQAAGDVEYIFVVNATKDMDGHYQFDMLPVKANITLNTKNRPVYDAVRGGEVEELKGKAISETTSGLFSMGQGEMRVFAMTDRPIAKVMTVVSNFKIDTTREKDPVRFDVRSFVTDADGLPLNGSIPMRIKVIDPLGNTRYNVLRATADGILNETFILAANDPTGTYTVEVTELLNNTVGTRTFANDGFKVAGAAIGEVPRAVYFGNDRENMKRFFRQYNNITLIPGSSDYSMQAAVKFAQDIEPWGITATIIPAEQAKERAEPYVDEYILETVGKSTWIDSVPYNNRQFDVPGPSVLFGNPEDNPLIADMVMLGNSGPILPFKPIRDEFPGRGRGMVAWQIDAIKYGVESVTIISYDEEGMIEARGSVYQTVAMQDPIMFLNQPEYAEVTPATVANIIPGFSIAYSLNLPDRAVQISTEGGNTFIMTFDGTVSVVDGNGTVIQSRDAEIFIDTVYPGYNNIDYLDDAIKEQLQKYLLPKTYETSGDLTAVIYWGGRVEFFNGATLVAAEQFEQDISAAAFNGNILVTVLATGQVLGLSL